jgi:hypothetical protein
LARNSNSWKIGSFVSKNISKEKKKEVDGFLTILPLPGCTKKKIYLVKKKGGVSTFEPRKEIIIITRRQLFFFFFLRLDILHPKNVFFLFFETVFIFFLKVNKQKKIDLKKKMAGNFEKKIYIYIRHGVHHCNDVSLPKGVF